MRPRRLAAAASAAVGVVVLSGCGLLEEPTPFVTLYADGTSVKAEASVYCFADGASLPADPSAPLPEGCEQFSEREPVMIAVRPGGDLAIDVDEKLKDSGWTINDSQQVVDEFYQSLPVPDDFGQTVRFDVVQLVDGEIGQRKGVWTFELRPES